MKDFVDAQVKELHQELEDNVILLVKQLLDIISGESEEITECLCILSGISKERLNDIHIYISDPEVSDTQLEDSDGACREREHEVGKNPVNITILEIHSLCNAIHFIASSIPSLHDSPLMDEIAEKSAFIVGRWMERVNYYYNCSGIFFNKLIRKSGTGSSGEFLSTYHIFIDTSALCDENTKILLDILISEIRNVPKQLKITVPKAVVDCLQDIAEDIGQNYILGVDEGLRNLTKLREVGILSVRGDGADTTVMSTFLSAFSRFKPVYKMMLITQDEILANAVQMLNASGVEGAEILICKVAESDIIDFWFESEPEEPGVNIAPVENPLPDDEALKTVSSFQLEESKADYLDDNDDEIETDAEKMSTLEEQLANMLGKNAKYTDDDSDDELSDDDDFDTEEDLKDDIDFSEEDILMENAFESDSWNLLD